ncbi:MAG: putative Ig domain-containing protein, partial [Proteobacteria bacterium]|nr:putative Ig domain-containing protein [Pseudomonadota bacterium]
TAVTGGIYAITVKVTDSSNPALSAAVPVSFKVGAVMVSPGQTPLAGVHGTPNEFTFNATNGNLPLSWAVTAGSVPPDLTLRTVGALSGMPTSASSASFAFTVTVTDSSASSPTSDSADYAITISEPPRPPTAPLGGLAVGLDGVLSGSPTSAGVSPSR